MRQNQQFKESSAICSLSVEARQQAAALGLESYCLHLTSKASRCFRTGGLLLSWATPSFSFRVGALGLGPAELHTGLPQANAFLQPGIQEQHPFCKAEFVLNKGQDCSELAGPGIL